MRREAGEWAVALSRFGVAARAIVFALLISTLEEARDESAAEILQRILSAVGRFVERRPFGDDLTLLVVRIP